MIRFLVVYCFFFQTKDGRRYAHYVLEFRRVLFRSGEAFLFQLECDDVLRSSRKNWYFHEAIERQWEDRRSRRWELESHKNLIRGTLARILKAIPEEDREGFSIDDWWGTPHAGIAISFKDAFTQDDRRMTALSLVIYNIETMSFRGGKIVADLHGLPMMTHESG